MPPPSRHHRWVWPSWVCVSDAKGRGVVMMAGRVVVTEDDTVTIGFGNVEVGEPPPTGAPAAPVSCVVVAEFLCFFVPPTAPPTTAATITTAATAMIITPFFVR